MIGASQRHLVNSRRSWNTPRMPNRAKNNNNRTSKANPPSPLQPCGSTVNRPSCPPPPLGPPLMPTPGPPHGPSRMSNPAEDHGSWEFAANGGRRKMCRTDNNGHNAQKVGKSFPFHPSTMYQNDLRGRGSQVSVHAPRSLNTISRPSAICCPSVALPITACNCIITLVPQTPFFY